MLLFNLVSLVLLVSLVSASGLTITDPVCVTRRDGGDVVYNDTECTVATSCPETHPIYLINDETCVSNQDLFSDCGFQLAPFQSNETVTDIGVRIENGTLSMLADEGGTLVPAQVVYQLNQTDSPENCSITSLEVYRGENTSIAIDYSGFTLGDNMTIQVQEDLLAYERSEYEGEVYRMNITCDDVMTTEGCFFFKLLSNQTHDISEDKFNCSVQGTAENETTECFTATTDTESPMTMEQTTMLTTLMMTSPTSCTCEAVSEERYIIYGLAAASGALLATVLLLCTVVTYLGTKLRRITRAQSLLKQIQKQDAARKAKPAETELVLMNPTTKLEFNEPMYEEVDKRRDVASKEYGVEEELVDNAAYIKSKNVPQPRYS